MKLKDKMMYYGASIRACLNPLAFELYSRDNHLTKKDYLDIVSRLKPGDVVLTKPKKGLLGSLFISGEYTHAGIYVGESFDEKYRHGFVHAIHPSATVEEFHTIITNYTGIKVYRSALSEQDLDLVCKRAKNTVNRHSSYDYDFLSDITSDKDADPDLNMYCSELIAFAYRPFVSDELGFKAGKIAGKRYYIPNEFTREGTGWDLAFLKDL